MITQNEWDSMVPYKKYKASKDGEILRIAKENTTAFVYAKGKSRRGWRYSPEYVMEVFTLVETTDENEKWQKRLDRALKALGKYGLWDQYTEIFKNLKTVNYYDKQAILKLYWSSPFRRYHNDEVDKANEEYLHTFGEYIDKYPFMFNKDKEGFMQVNTDYLFETSECNLKSMNFGYENKFYKEQIKKSLEEKNDYRIPYRITTSYDISFQYDAENKKAWYSEEYIGTGNGHYYIALDENTALFVEND